MWCTKAVLLLLLTVAWTGRAETDHFGPEVERPTHERTGRQACEQSVTTVGGKSACKKELLFMDDFNNLDETKWRKDLMLAASPDFEFVMYDASHRNCFVKNGTLHLKPTIPDNVQRFALTGRIDLRKRGCTGAAPEECTQNASAYNILPPVTSARIKTSQSFSFKYGEVEIRAKLPDGNWLYPQIWLEPRENFYGPNYDSGRMVIAEARGNAQLLDSEGRDIGCRQLMGGIIYVKDEPDRSLGLRRIDRGDDTDEGWNDDFHIYKFKWTPDNVVMSVDGKNYGAIQATNGGFGILIDSEKWIEGTPMAPFDREFYITLGVGAGGVRHFPDNTTVGGKPKPWKNTSVKAKLDFLRDRNNWKYSWAWEEAALQVDYIKVWAL